MKKYFIFFIIAWFIFVFHAIYTRHAIYGDGNGYYAYSQAIYFDKSLNFQPVYNYLQKFQGRTGEFSRLFWNLSNNPYSIGTGIVWLPSMFAMSLFTSNRFSLIYELGPGLTGIVCMLAGLYFIERYLSKHFSKKATFWTILTLFFGSNVFYYSTFEPALSHQPAFFLVAALLFLTVDKYNKPGLFLVGLLSGLLANIRIGDSILLIPVLFAIKDRGLKLIYFVLGFLITLSPQLINQILQYGGIFSNPYVNGENGSFQISLNSAFLTLFSLRRGFFTWTPIFILATYGLIKTHAYLILATVVIYWLTASFWTGGLSAGFGLRLMFSSIPYFSAGIAYVYDKINLKRIWQSFSFFSVYNAFLILGFYLLGWKNLP